jgi:putative flippase GtrA
MFDHTVWFRVIDAQKWRYVLNGGVATLAHYATLRVLMALYPSTDPGVCNLGASAVGISVSFLGNRLIVFAGSTKWLWGQLWQFVLLYVALSVVQGLFMHLLVANLELNVTVSFLMCTAFQFVAGFWANKAIVFHG